MQFEADIEPISLQKLAPVFDTTSGTGSVTAGNSSQLSDGASATLVMSSDRAKALGIDASQVVSASTGVIGMKLPHHKIVAALPKLVDQLSMSAWV